MLNWFNRNRTTNVIVPAESAARDHASSLLASLLNMAWFVEARDPYTGGHLWRVSRYARLLAERADFDDASAARIGLGGFLHDLGKVGIPDAILNKTVRLTDEEFIIIKTHPSIGQRMLSGHPLASLVSDAVGLHHERPDGHGYPQGLTRDEIPIMASIVGICDAFDAMTSFRPYRSAMSRDKALSIIGEQRGKQFDVRYAGLFVQMGHEGALDHVMGHSDDGIPLQSCPMCGPTLVMRQDSQEGDLLYCPNCGGESELTLNDGSLRAVPTGQRGSAADLEPDVDRILIARTVREAVDALPVSALLAASSTLGD